MATLSDWQRFKPAATCHGLAALVMIRKGGTADTCYTVGRWANC